MKILEKIACLTAKQEKKTIFVTATDTSVGKTFICSMLLAFLQKEKINAHYQKWIATGGGQFPQDLIDCYENAKVVLPGSLMEFQSSYNFKFPASPHLAAELEGEKINLELIKEQFDYLSKNVDFLIVEGVGGVMVPLTRNILLLDLLEKIRPAIILVARSGLGTINHTLLTLNSLQQRKLDIKGIIFSDGQIEKSDLQEGALNENDEIIIKDNIKTIDEFSGVDILGRLPFCQDFDEAMNSFLPIGNKFLDLMSIKRN
jgi:dethiobiotin synthetase